MQLGNRGEKLPSLAAVDFMSEEMALNGILLDRVLAHKTDEDGIVFIITKMTVFSE